MLTACERGIIIKMSIISVTKSEMKKTGGKAKEPGRSGRECNWIVTMQLYRALQLIPGTN